MSFPPGFLDDIRNRVSLVGLVGKRVQLKQRGRGDFWGLSPFANEKTPSFHVREDKGDFHCFATGEHGDHFSWIMKMEGVSFPEAVERLAGEAGLDMPERTPEQRERDEVRAGLTDIAGIAATWYQKQLQGPAGREARAYLEQRGLKENTIRSFGLGFAPEDGAAFASAMKEQKVDAGLLIEAGLLRRSDRGGSPYAMFRNRILFPIADKRGRTIAFGGRFMGDAKAVGVGKYINSPDTPLFDKGRTLYNRHNARQPAYDGQPLVVVEGYLDVIALAEAGHAAAVAPLGTALTEGHLEDLWRLVDEPVLCLDGDEAGRRAAFRAAERALPLLQPGKSLRFVFLPPGEDPDTLVRSQGLTAFSALVDAASPLDKVLWEQEWAHTPVDTPERRASLERRLHDIAGRIGDEAVRKQYHRQFSDRLWEAFKRQPAKRAYTPPGRRNDRGYSRPYAQPEPPTASLPTMRLVLPRRSQQVVLAILANHPQLLPDYVETIDRIAFDDDLDKLRQGLQNLALSDSELDVEAVDHHFAGSDFESVLRSVRDRRVYALDVSARPGASLEKAQEGLDDIIRIRSQEALQNELRSSAGGVGSDHDKNHRGIVALHKVYSAGETVSFSDEQDG